MPDTASHLDDVGRVVGGLTQLGLRPVLVGGMAMVTIRSRALDLIAIQRREAFREFDQ